MKYSIKDLTDAISCSKAAELVSKVKREPVIIEEKKTSPWKIVLIVIGVLAVVGTAAYFLYRYFCPDYLDDFDDDFDDEFDDDFFEDEDDEVEVKTEAKEEAKDEAAAEE